ncbi:dATP/dGTP diphosphohydrolase domain-containing protein [Anaeroselena agilis]|uniref:DUF5664 domain-containing protein n=1 Tax=Anaeroselena agilis TaxID=3063788 RepID=A0ABU3NUY0_9FIRM|nr:DUF5664 domain-containing protein [Selenomonadales bacterium 4137-cl]
MVIKGVGPDAPIVTNEHGGRQSAVPYAFHLFDPQAIIATAEVMAYGATKHSPDNWRKITVEEHLNHMIGHAYAALAGDTQDDHLGHMAARAHMALAVDLENRRKGAEGTSTKPDDKYCETCYFNFCLIDEASCDLCEAGSKWKQAQKKK